MIKNKFFIGQKVWVSVPFGDKEEDWKIKNDTIVIIKWSGIYECLEYYLDFNLYLPFLETSIHKTKEGAEND